MTSKSYVLGHSPSEIRRLELQGAFLQPPTVRLLQAAGLAAGMSVLDIGTGAGDVAMLAARIVGPQGTVVGIDRNEAVIERARERAGSEGLDRVRFERCDLLEAGALGAFDLVVGRFVLCFQPDKAAFVRSAAALVKPGGVLAFLEPMAGRDQRFSTPRAPLYDWTIGKIIEAFETAGADVDVGGCLTAVFQDAGLAAPGLLAELPLGGPSSLVPEWACETLSSLAPALAAVGKLQDMDFADHTARIREEALGSRSQLFLPHTIGAWSPIA